MKNRTELAQYFASLGFKCGAEVGTAFGHYAEILCQNIPSLSLLLIDSWDTRENSKREERVGIPGKAYVGELLKEYNVTLIQGTSAEVVKTIPNKSLDFVFIDANHSYLSVREDVREWSKKVRSGGIVSGHDYYITKFTKNTGVIDAVNEYVKENSLELLLTDWDNTNPWADDRQPCWYFIKP